MSKPERVYVCARLCLLCEQACVCAEHEGRRWVDEKYGLRMVSI